MNDLEKRMKCYEDVNRNYLQRRMPTIIRIDGKAFHTFTKGLMKPFDKQFMNCMQSTAHYLCENIQGCKLAYVQSDEISLLLTDYETHTTQSWFDKNINKMVSVSASMATLKFNSEMATVIDLAKHLRQRYVDGYRYTENQWNIILKELKPTWNFNDDMIWADVYYYWEILINKYMKALFDSRVFNLSKEEVCNYFVYRQQDATRNAISMVGQANFLHSQLQNKSSSEIQEMLFQEKGINFNDLPKVQRRGCCVIKESSIKNYTKDDGETRSIETFKWVIDDKIPIFTQDREYIEQYI